MRFAEWLRDPQVVRSSKANFLPIPNSDLNEYSLNYGLFLLFTVFSLNNLGGNSRQKMIFEKADLIGVGGFLSIFALK